MSEVLSEQERKALEGRWAAEREHAARHGLSVEEREEFAQFSDDELRSRAEDHRDEAHALRARATDLRAEAEPGGPALSSAISRAQRRFIDVVESLGSLDGEEYDAALLHAAGLFTVSVDLRFRQALAEVVRDDVRNAHLRAQAKELELAADRQRDAAIVVGRELDARAGESVRVSSAA